MHFRANVPQVEHGIEDLYRLEQPSHAQFRITFHQGLQQNTPWVWSSNSYIVCCIISIFLDEIMTWATSFADRDKCDKNLASSVRISLNNTIGPLSAVGNVHFKVDGCHPVHAMAWE